jgi:tetratricopeptide (TPR) repeat protein
MTGYSTSEVAKILGLSPAQVRGYVRAGFLSPERDVDGNMRFSFPDLAFLRTARGLMSSRVPPRRVKRALERLRQQLPEDRPLNEVRIATEGSRIVVEDAAGRWQPESGQAVFDFDAAGEGVGGSPPSNVARRSFEPARNAQGAGDAFTADDWFEWGCELEGEDAKRAREAYEEALALDPDHAGAHVNLGRLLHEAGDPAAAEPHYERALEVRPEDATAAYNLGVALEDLGKLPEALLAYQKAVRLEPDNVDAHYNAASLAERLGRSAEAVRHLAAYRRLTRKR